MIDNGGYRLHEISKLTLAMGKDADFYKKFVDFSAYGINEQDFIKGIFNYQSIWSADNSPETIIAKEYIANEREGTWQRITTLLTPNLVSKQAWATIVPIQELVDAYWTADGKTTPVLSTMDQRIADYKSLIQEVEALKSPDVTYSKAVHSIVNTLPSKAYMEQYKNRDTRLYASILYPGAIWNDVLGDNTFVWQNNGKANNTSKTGYNYRKMVDPNETIYRKSNDFPLIRYAEILLMYAEAQNEVAGADGSVYDALNKIRNRVGMPDVTAGLSKEAMRDVIRNERRIELACEGHRWNDIRRWGISSQVMKDIHSIQVELAQKRRWEDKYVRLPFPISAIDRNPKLKEAQKAKGY
ncbi:hypothetical protein CAPN004_02310 [Capnocytophaga cynodegmi]|nr:hypothetical protein CAPN004_02310 [Capnocytophaga cynodegmi]